MKKIFSLLIFIALLYAPTALVASSETLVSYEPIDPNLGYFASLPYTVGTSFRFEHDTVLTGLGFWATAATPIYEEGATTTPYWRFFIDTALLSTGVGGWVPKDSLFYAQPGDSEVTRTPWTKDFYNLYGERYDSMTGYNYRYNFETPVSLEGGVTYVLQYQYMLEVFREGVGLRYLGDENFSAYAYCFLEDASEHEFRTLQNSLPLATSRLAYQLFGYTAPVSEPVTILLLGLGLVGIEGVRRKFIS